MYKFIKTLLHCIFFLYGQNQDIPIDGIAAIVGENIILKIEKLLILLNEVLLYGQMI